MNSDIFIALIGFAGICVGAIFGYLGRTKKHAVMDAKREQEQQDSFSKVFEEMKKINKKLDEHNHYAMRFEEIDKILVAIKKDIEYIRKDKK